MEKALKEFAVGEEGTVKRIIAEGNIKRRLYDMGVTPGARIKVKKFATMGDPIEVTIRGYELSLRKSEAECVIMEVK